MTEKSGKSQGISAFYLKFWKSQGISYLTEKSESFLIFIENSGKVKDFENFMA